MMFGVQAASDGGSSPALPIAMNTLMTEPVGERDDDAEADAVEGAAAAGGHAEGDREQRHDEGHERERELPLELDRLRQEVEAARRQLVDRSAQLRRRSSSRCRPVSVSK